MQQTKKSVQNEIKLKEIIQELKKSKFFDIVKEYKNVYEIYYKKIIPMWVFEFLLHNSIKFDFNIKYVDDTCICLTIYKKKDYDFD